MFLPVQILVNPFIPEMGIFTQRMTETTCPTKVRDRGRVTIPADVRNNLGIEEGDYLLLNVEPLPAGEQ